MIPRCFMLKNGSTAVLRTAVPEDAAQMIAYLRACRGGDGLPAAPAGGMGGTFPWKQRKPAAGHGAPDGKSDAGVLGKGGDRRHLSGCLHESAETPAPRHGCPSRCAGRIGVRVFPASCLRRWKPLRRERGVTQLELAYIQGNERARHLYDRMALWRRDAALMPCASGMALWQMRSS